MVPAYLTILHPFRPAQREGSPKLIIPPLKRFGKAKEPHHTQLTLSSYSYQGSVSLAGSYLVDMPGPNPTQEGGSQVPMILFSESP